MRPTEKIEESIRNLQDTTRPDTDRRILEDVCRQLDASRKTSSVSRAGERRYVMNRSRVIKAAAAAAIALKRGLVKSPVRIKLTGGELRIRWNGKDLLYLAGNAVEVFRGELKASLD